MFDIPTLLLMIWFGTDLAFHSQDVLELSPNFLIELSVGGGMFDMPPLLLMKPCRSPGVCFEGPLYKPYAMICSLATWRDNWGPTALGHL